MILYVTVAWTATYATARLEDRHFAKAPPIDHLSHLWYYAQVKRRGKLAPAIWVFVLLASATAGVGVVWVSGVWRAPVEGVPIPPAADDPQPGLDLPDSVAMRYARALQDGDADGVMEMTLWIIDRLRHTALGSDDPSQVENARALLRRKLTERTVEGNQLTPQGIEDKYIFAKGASLEAVGLTEGRSDLHVPARICTWIRVTYPHARNALRGDVGAPIRSVTVGIHESEGGLVLKAGIIGNVEIDYDSISYDWDAD
jgi:hypothetical protein